MKKEIKRCNALDNDGKQCRKKSALTMEYFGDHEHYYPYNEKVVTWVKVNFCVEHFIGTGGKIIN